MAARKLTEHREDDHQPPKSEASTRSLSVPCRSYDPPDEETKRRWAEENKQRQEQERRERHEAEQRWRYKNAELPERHSSKRIDDGECPNEWLEARDKIIGRMGTGFLIALLGKRGTGKTQIAQQLVMASAKALGAPRYTRASTLFLELKDSYVSRKASELQVVESFRKPTLLILDEFQERGETDFEQRTLTAIIDLRYGDQTDTLIIANQTKERFYESAGESIADRLRETGGIIECTWPSFRDRQTDPDAGELTGGCQ